MVWKYSLREGEVGAMRPRILATGMEFAFPSWLSSLETVFPPPGHELNIAPARDDEWMFPALIELAAQNGYRYKPTGVADGPNFLPINGSVNCHTDSGYGIIVACLVHDEGSFHANSELVCRYGAMTLGKGDVFAFDSREWHGWISHGFSVLACISVSPKKSRKSASPPSIVAAS
jgi:hypothetical protein